MALNQPREEPPAADSSSNSENDTGPLDALFRQMHLKGDFPALSQTISAISRITADSDESVQTLSSVLLKDFALTNKLLRLVNSSTYGRFSGTISTISRAVMILGFDVVRSLAVTLTLFEHMQKNAQTSQLKEDVIAAYFTGVVAQRMAALYGVPDSEEGFVCGVFHHLGRLLTTYYFHDESMEIAKRVQQAETEDKASRTVLGLSYEDLGVGVARHWHLPERIVNSIQHTAAPRMLKSSNPSDRLKLVANLATALCRTASELEPARKATELDKLRRDFAGGLNLGKEQFTEVVEDSIQQFLDEAGMFVIGSNKSSVLKSIKHWSDGKHEDKSDSDTLTEVSVENTLPGEDTSDEGAPRVLTVVAANPASADHDPGAALAAGMQDITNALVGDYNLNDVLRIILETMYRGMRFSQVLLCTRDVSSNELRARFGFGTGIENLLKHFSVPLAQAQDVFQLALQKNVDLIISDTHSDTIVSRIPDWYRKYINARAFLLLPIVINGKAIGMFYADHDAGELVIEPHLLRLLKTLRNQAILAIRQKY